MSIDANLPSGWIATVSATACASVRDGTHDTPQYIERGIPLVTSKHLLPQGIDFSNTKFISEEAHNEISKRSGVRPGDVLFAMIGTVGNPVVVSTAKQFSIKNVALFKENASVLRPAYLRYWLCAPQLTKWLKPRLKGTNQKFAPLELLRAIPILLAPINEQDRIVAKVEELFSDLDAGVAALERARANLKRYRAAVLKAAVEGRLTESWRAEHPDVEPASQHLERILTERRQKWESAQLAKYAATGREPPKNWKSKYVEPTSPDITNLPAIPLTWEWAKLESLGEIVGGITKDQKKANKPGMREVPYLRVANVQRGWLDLAEMKTIAASTEEIDELRLEPGDVLFTEGGDRDKLGRGWVWSGEVVECIHQNHIFRCRLICSEMQPKLISHHGNTFGKEWFINAGKQTTNLASINLGILRRFPVPVAPLKEQREIATLVEEKLSGVDAAEAEIDSGLQRAARLRQSILKQAFEGKLVPQDPADEPASVLLDRLRVTRTVQESNGKLSKTRRISKVRAPKQ